MLKLSVHICCIFCLYAFNKKIFSIPTIHSPFLNHYHFLIHATVYNDSKNILKTLVPQSAALDSLTPFGCREIAPLLGEFWYYNLIERFRSESTQQYCLI